MEWQDMLNAFLSTLMTGVATVVGCAVVKYGVLIGKQGYKYIETKAKEKNLDYLLKVGKQCWDQVEENYRIGDKIVEQFNSKADYFDTLIKKQFKFIDQSEIDSVRQSIAAEYNKYKSCTPSIQSIPIDQIKPEAIEEDVQINTVSEEESKAVYDATGKGDKFMQTVYNDLSKQS